MESDSEEADKQNTVRDKGLEEGAARYRVESHFHTIHFKRLKLCEY